MNKTTMKKRMYLILLGLAVLTTAPAWAGSMTISRVWPEKICYKPGETATIAVDIKNQAAAAATAKVSLTIRWGIDGQADLPGQTMTVPGKSQVTALFSYSVPKDHKWGHEIYATVTDESGTRSDGREYFAVGEDSWILGHYQTLFWLRGAKKSGAIDNSILPGFRQKYVTTIEAYSWAPSCFGGMTSDTDIWRSGQGNYKEGKEDWQYLVSQAHKMGMTVVTYAMLETNGPVGCDFSRKHPDWLTYDKNGRPVDAFFDLDKLELQRTDPGKSEPGTYFGLMMGEFLATNPQVGDFWIDDLIKSIEMFGWNGFRSDGNPSVVGGYDYKGTLHELPNPGPANAEYIQKTYSRLRQHFPKVLFGWNAGASGNPFFYPATEDERKTAFPGSSYMLFESFNSVGQASSPYHAWKKLAPYLENEEAAVRKYGSYGHCGWMPSNRYLEAVVSACGSHVDPTVISANWDNYRRFEFRCSEFLWDNTLRYVRPGDSAVSVEGPARVWWQDFVHARDLPGGGKRVILHLVNMPEKDDEAWADQPPAPAANVKVSFKNPDGKKPKKIGAFSPDTPGYTVAVTPADDGSITIPEVKLWTLVVADY